MSRQFSGSNLWLDLHLNLFQAQSTTVNEKKNPNAYPDYKSAVCKCAFVHECTERDGDAAEPLQMQLAVEHTSVLTVAMSAGRRDGITLTEHSTDPTNTRDLTANEMGVHMLPSAERNTIAL